MPLLGATAGEGTNFTGLDLSEHLLLCLCRFNPSMSPALARPQSFRALACAHSLVDHAAIVACRVAEQPRAAVGQA